MSMFKRAERKRVFLKIGLMGPSGSGKTYSAIKLAKGLANGGKIAALDTENGSLSLYAHLAEVDVCDLQPPFNPKKFIEAIDFAVKEGYSVLIVDSMTHAWKYILDYKESLDKAGGNSFTNWGKAKPLFDELKDRLNQAPIHIVACMRAKDEYILEKNGAGKDTPRKVGMGAILEPGSEYEYTVVFGIGMDHRAEASKDRTSMFAGESFKIDESVGQRFVEWLNSGAEPDPVRPGIINPDPRAILNGWELTSSQLDALKEAARVQGAKLSELITRAAAAHRDNVATDADFSRWMAETFPTAKPDGEPATTAPSPAEGIPTEAQGALPVEEPVKEEPKGAKEKGKKEATTAHA